jgi:hypothetical protein
MNDRFVNNRILESVFRPQYRYGCAIAALTTVLNYLYSSRLGIITQEQIGRELNLEIRDIGTKIDPGNKEIMEWFCRFMKKRKLNGKVRVYTDNGTNKYFEALKLVVDSPHKILMYHLENHYNIVCGFYDSPTTPTDAYSNDSNAEGWLIFADSNNDPIWCRSWNDVLKSFKRWRSHCLLLFESQMG